jgi:hypothetical protein
MIFVFEITYTFLSFHNSYADAAEFIFTAALLCLQQASGLYRVSTYLLIMLISHSGVATGVLTA